MAGKFRIGQKVLVRGNFGGGHLEEVTIEGFGEKDGRATIDYVDADGEGSWGYEDQFQFI